MVGPGSKQPFGLANQRLNVQPIELSDDLRPFSTLLIA